MAFINVRGKMSYHVKNTQNDKFLSDTLVKKHAQKVANDPWDSFLFSGISGWSSTREHPGIP